MGKSVPDYFTNLLALFAFFHSSAFVKQPLLYYLKNVSVIETVPNITKGYQGITSRLLK